MKLFGIIIIIIVTLLIFEDISTQQVFANTTFFQTLDVSTNIDVPEGLTFSPNGLKMYITDDTGDLIEEYALSSPWDISTASHAASNLPILDAQTNVPEDMEFNADGTKMYLVDRDGDAVLEYTLSVAYDVSEAVYESGANADVSNETGNPEDIVFSSDGLKMFILENEGTDTVLEYALGSAYDVSDETYTDAFVITGFTTGTDAMEFSSDGTTLFVSHNKGVSMYTLSTAWDVSTGLYVDLLDLTSVIDNPKGLAFSSDGIQMFITGTSDAVHEFQLQIAWDLFSIPTSSLQLFSPHIHDEIKISINSEDSTIVYLKDNEIKHIEARVGDTVNVTVSIGDDTELNSITDVKFITNYANKPSDMNRYFTTNYNDYGQVGLSVYEWHHTGDDLTYDYSGNISWNAPSVEIKTRTETFHEYVGTLLLSEKELLLTYSMNMDKIMPQTQAGLKIADTSNMRSNFILPFTLEILQQESDIIAEKIIEDPIENPIENPIEDPIEEIIIKEDTLLSMSLNKEKYQNGDKLIILGHIQNYDVDLMNGKNINYKIKSPENKIIVTGSVTPKTNGTFEFSTFAMDTLWKTDGNYIFSASIGFGSAKEIILIMYDNKEFKNLNLQTVVDEKIVTLPVVELESVVGEHEFYEEHEPTPLGIASFVDATKDPQSYVDRYNNEPTYKEWFDENYSQYSSIYEAVGLEQPVAEQPVAEQPVAEQPVAEQPVAEVQSRITCGAGTESVNDICQVIQTEEKSARGGGCLIATATYGSEMANEVQQLRELRDNQLLNTESGTAFMSTFNNIYYSFSPIVADYERENPLFKEAVKLAITPMISSLSLMDNANSESEVISLGLSVIMLNLGMYLGVPAVVIVGIRKRI